MRSHRFQQILTLLAFSCLSTLSLNAQSTLSPELRSKIDETARQVLKSTGVPSASLAVVQDGKIAYAQAYG